MYVAVVRKNGICVMDRCNYHNQSLLQMLKQRHRGGQAPNTVEFQTSCIYIVGYSTQGRAIFNII